MARLWPLLSKRETTMGLYTYIGVQEPISNVAWLIIGDGFS